LYYDAIIIGSGPNGLAAAIRLAQKNLKVKIFEAMDTIGGGARTAELTLPGFKHDICSAILPLGFGSPFFKKLPLEQHGLEWIHPPVSIAHPFDDGSAVSVTKSFDENLLERSFGKDSNLYRKIFQPLSENWDLIEKDLLGPLRFPSHPIAAAKFGYHAVHSAESFVKKFGNIKTRTFFLGLAAHGILPLNNIFTSAIGLVLGIYAHKYGWPFPKGGTQSLTNALASFFISLGGEIETNTEVKTFEELPSAKAYLFDITPKQLIKITGHKFPNSYLASLKKYKYGPGVFKIDFATDDLIPWTAWECREAAVVHIGGSPEEIIESEESVWKGKLTRVPFIITAQQSLFDATRTPAGKHTVWAYCHVPSGYNEDISELVTNQIERFAPGFRKIILAKTIHTPSAFEKYNPNYVGGDINGGAQTWDQLFTRPVFSLTPYRTPAKGIYICSSSTPPGGGVHGMCGFHAAETVLKDLRIAR